MKTRTLAVAAATAATVTLILNAAIALSIAQRLNSIERKLEYQLKRSHRPPTQSLTEREMESFENAVFKYGARIGWDCYRMGGSTNDLNYLVRAQERGDDDAIATWFEERIDAIWADER